MKGRYFKLAQVVHGFAEANTVGLPWLGKLRGKHDFFQGLGILQQVREIIF